MNEWTLALLLKIARRGWHKPGVAHFKGYDMTIVECRTVDEAIELANDGGVVLNPDLPHHLWRLDKHRLIHVGAFNSPVAAMMVAYQSPIVLLVAGPSTTAPLYIKYC